MRNAADIQKPFYLEKSINFGSAVDSSIFVFYVAQTDLVSGYATYNTGIINFPNNKNGIVGVTGGFYDTLFSVNDFISIVKYLTINDISYVWITVFLLLVSL